MASITVNVKQSKTKTQLVFSEQAVDSLARSMVDRLIHLGILEEHQLEEYLIETSELGNNLQDLYEEVKAERLLSHEEVFGEPL